MASPNEQRTINDPTIAVSESEKDQTSLFQESKSQSTELEKSEGEKNFADEMGDQDVLMELDNGQDKTDSSTAEPLSTLENDHTEMGANVNNSETFVERSSGVEEDSAIKEDIKENFDNVKSPVKEASLLSMVKGTDKEEGEKITENEEVKLLDLNETDKRETENIDEESEQALLKEGGDDNEISGNNLNDGEEENMDTSESFVSDKLQQPQHFGDKEVSETNSRQDADSEVEMEMKRASTIHLPESVYNIDEETRMGLDQTPSDCLTSSLITPLPPKKLFHLDTDTKDSVDSETKMSANTDTEDIRLRNTIGVDQENTKDSVASDSVTTEGPTPSKRMRGCREGLGNVFTESKHIITAENLFEYQWPQDGGEWHLLQEHISEFLKVKSFKRKYPDLYRRVCDKEEKDFLREKGVVTETQSDLGLTALRSDEVYDLMMKDYSDRYKEYVTVLQEKQKRVMREKHKEYGVAKLDKTKMEAYSKKAARLAAEFNASLMREKREERQAYFDLQTYTIHHAKNRYRCLPPEETKIKSYPVALIAGQYQDKVRMYKPEELSNFPIKTVLTDPPSKVKYVLRPPASLMEPVDAPVVDVSAEGDSKTNGNTEDIDSQEDEKDKENIVGGISEQESEVSSLIVETDQADAATPFKFDKRGKLVSAKKLTKSGGSGKFTSSPDRGKKLGGGRKKEEPVEDDGGVDGEKGVTKIHGLEKCRICKQRSSKEDRLKDKLIRCAQCLKIGHMSCLDLTEELVAVIKTYPWQCMECKACVQCMDPYDEDKMMFCDRCDRGYHTFCIGLDALPTGHWECRSCVDRKPDGEQDNDACKDINSHNVIKDENQDSQDSFRDGSSGGKVNIKLSKGILDFKPMTENDLTTDYLMKLAGRNTNWRRDTGTEEAPPPIVKPATTPTADSAITASVSTAAVEATLSAPTPTGKKVGRRKKSEMNLNPTRSRPDRVQGARQSRRIKAREEEEDEEKKVEGEEDEEKKSGEEKEDKRRKKKKKDGRGLRTNIGEDGSVHVKEEGEEDEDSMKAGGYEVMEGVDDSQAMVFEKNEEEEKEEKNEENVDEKTSRESVEGEKDCQKMEEVKEEKEEEVKDEKGRMNSGVENRGEEDGVRGGNDELVMQAMEVGNDIDNNKSESELLEAIDKLVEINDGAETVGTVAVEGFNLKKDDDASFVEPDSTTATTTSSSTTSQDNNAGVGDDMPGTNYSHSEVEATDDSVDENKIDASSNEESASFVGVTVDNTNANIIEDSEIESAVSSILSNAENVSESSGHNVTHSFPGPVEEPVTSTASKPESGIESKLSIGNTDLSSVISSSSVSSSSPSVSSSSPSISTEITSSSSLGFDADVAQIPISCATSTSPSSSSTTPLLPIPVSSVPLPVSPSADIPLAPTSSLSSSQPISSMSSSSPAATPLTTQESENTDPSDIPLPMDTE